MAQTTTNVSRLVLATPDLGFDTDDGGTALHAALQNIFTKLGDNIGCRWTGQVTVDDANYVDLVHNYAMAIGAIKIIWFDAAGAQLTQDAFDTIGLTVAQQDTNTIRVTNATGSQKQFYAVMLPYRQSVRNADMDKSKSAIAITASYNFTADTLGDVDFIVAALTAAGSITLPSASANKGREIKIYLASITVGELTIGGVVGGDVTLDTANTSATVRSNGTSWYNVGGGGAGGGAGLEVRTFPFKVHGVSTTASHFVQTGDAKLRPGDPVAIQDRAGQVCAFNDKEVYDPLAKQGNEAFNAIPCLWTNVANHKPSTGQVRSGDSLPHPTDETKAVHVYAHDGTPNVIEVMIVQHTVNDLTPTVTASQTLGFTTTGYAFSIQMCRIGTGNTYCVAIADQSGNAYAKIFSVTGDTIVTGAEQTIHGSGNVFNSVHNYVIPRYCPINDEVFIAYFTTTTLNIQMCSHSGTSLTLGTSVALTSQGSTYLYSFECLWRKRNGSTGYWWALATFNNTAGGTYLGAWLDDLVGGTTAVKSSLWCGAYSERAKIATSPDDETIDGTDYPSQLGVTCKDVAVFSPRSGRPRISTARFESLQNTSPNIVSNDADYPQIELYNELGTRYSDILDENFKNRVICIGPDIFCAVWKSHASGFGYLLPYSIRASRVHRMGLVRSMDWALSVCPIGKGGSLSAVAADYASENTIEAMGIGGMGSVRQHRHIGYAVSGPVNDGSNIDVQLRGPVVTGFSNLVPGLIYYKSDQEPMTSTQLSTCATPWVMGIAISDTELMMVNETLSCRSYVLHDSNFVPVLEDQAGFPSGTDFATWYEINGSQCTWYCQGQYTSGRNTHWLTMVLPPHFPFPKFHPDTDYMDMPATNPQTRYMIMGAGHLSIDQNDDEFGRECFGHAYLVSRAGGGNPTWAVIRSGATASSKQYWSFAITYPWKDL